MMRVVVTILLLGSVWLSLSVLGGSVIHRLVEQELAGQEESSQAVKQLQFALRLDPGNPKTMALMGRLQSPEEALETYRALSRITPRDPHVWASIFATKVKMQELDAEAREALGEAVRLGPYEPGVQEFLIEYGSRRWLILDAWTRRQIVEAGVRSLENQSAHRRTKISQILNRRGLMGMTCASPRLGDHPACTRYRG